MNAFAVVVVAKLQELAFEINGIPEHDLIEKLSPDRPNKALDKGIPDERQRRRPSGSRSRSIVFGQYSADHVLVNLDAEGRGNDERDPRAAEAWIAALEIDDRTDELA